MFIDLPSCPIPINPKDLASFMVTHGQRAVEVGRLPLCLCLRASPALTPPKLRSFLMNDIRKASLQQTVMLFEKHRSFSLWSAIFDFDFTVSFDQNGQAASTEQNI